MTVLSKSCNLDSLEKINFTYTKFHVKGENRSKVKRSYRFKSSFALDADIACGLYLEIINNQNGLNDQIV